ncbi:MAG TPA: alpha/beta hydrolase [Pseudomonadales bacterium]|nr:alpha/beta hydrolase [Pseudomonadales bacterium]
MSAPPNDQESDQANSALGTELPPAVSGEDRLVDGRAGQIRVRVAGQGPPLLLLHSINAAASAAEVAPVHEWARERFTVYSPDLPGYGRSDRSARAYDIRLFTDAVHDLLDLIAAEQGADVPVRAVGLSLSCEFLVRAATEAPARFARLALVTPTGFDRRASRWREAPETHRQVDWLASILARPRVGEFLFRQLTRPAVVRYFLKRTFGTDRIDETLWRYCCRSVRHPGARHAPLAFLSGRLFAADIRNLLEALELPVWLAHGTRGDFRDFSGATWALERDNWQLQAWPTGAIPWFEMPAEFLHDLGVFLDG